MIPGMSGKQNHKLTSEETPEGRSLKINTSSAALYRRMVLLGCLAIFASAGCFYMSTVIVRWARAEVVIDAAYFVFFRFVLGFLVVMGVLAIQRRWLTPGRLDLVIGRTVFNCIAVFCFYRAVTATSLAEANILNMTYPIFLAILSWVVLKEQRDRVAVLMVGVAFGGIWLILVPGKITPDLQNLWGLASGISASVAILYLNISRRYHDTETVLFYVFGLGGVLIYAVFFDRIFWPNDAEFRYLFLCGAFGVAGQYLLTFGFRYVTAVEGSIISSTRILMAAILGPWIALDPPLTFAGWAGALLIFLANGVLAVRKARE